MREPIQSRPGEAFAAEDFGPVFERQVGRHDQAVPFVGGGDDIEQQLRPGLAGGDVAEFVEDQEVELVQRLPVAEQLALFLASVTLFIRSFISPGRITSRPVTEESSYPPCSSAEVVAYYSQLDVSILWQ